MKSIVISLAAIIVFVFPDASLTSVINGIVYDQSSNLPLEDVIVRIPGTTLETKTKNDGTFTLNFDKNRAILSFFTSTHFLKEVSWLEGKYLKVPLKLISEKNQEERVLEEINYLPVQAGVNNGKNSRSRLNTLAGQMQWDDPVNLNTEDYDFIRENIFQDVHIHPTSTFSADVDHASYSNLRRFLDQGQQPPADAIRIEEMVNYFQYDYSEPTNHEPLRIYQELGPCPWKHSHQLLHVGLKAKNIDPENLPASNLVFLIDVSGSMASENKLPLVKKSFELLLEHLRPHDQIAIVTYAGRSGIHLPSTSAGDKGEINYAIQQLSAGGSTAGAAGIETAYELAKAHFIKGGNNRVILATDGDFNIGTSSDSELVRMIEKQKSSGIYLSVLGFGMGNYKDNKMQKLAQAGNGNHYYIDQLKEAKKVLIHEFTGSLFTIANDVKIQIEFNPRYVAGYRLLGYENRILQREDFKNEKRDAGEIGFGHQVTALYEIIPTGVKSDYLSDVDPLKYQSRKIISEFTIDEWLTIRLRYKKPGESDSKLVEEVVKSPATETRTTSIDFRWSAAVASFGMTLRDSEFKGASDINLVMKLASDAIGEDPFGYRREFVGMVEGVRGLAWMDD